MYKNEFLYQNLIRGEKIMNTKIKKSKALKLLKLNFEKGELK